MTQLTGVVIGAGDRGAHAYTPLLLTEPGLGRIVGVAEPDAVRRNAFAERFGVSKERRFADHRDLLAGPAIADFALVPASACSNPARFAAMCTRLWWRWLRSRPTSRIPMAG